MNLLSLYQWRKLQTSNNQKLAQSAIKNRRKQLMKEHDLIENALEFDGSLDHFRKSGVNNSRKSQIADHNGFNKRASTPQPYTAVSASAQKLKNASNK